MTASVRVGPSRWRESRGRYYEDFNVGDVYEHRPGRTITETDNTWFTLLTMNTHPLHFDAAYAAKTEFGRPVVNSCLTLSLVVGMSVSDVSEKAVANLGWKSIELTAPVFPGDTIYAESEVLAKRESASRPAQGIVTVRTRGLKADGSVFMTLERAILVPKRGAAGGDAAQRDRSAPRSKRQGRQRREAQGDGRGKRRGDARSERRGTRRGKRRGAESRKR